MLKKYFFLLIVLCLFILSSCDDKKDNPVSAEEKANELKPEKKSLSEAQAKEDQLRADAEAKAKLDQLGAEAEATLDQLRKLDQLRAGVTKVKEENRSLVLPICERTEQVKQAILDKLKKTDCNTVTEQELQAIVSLDLERKGITKLKAGDFDNLISLQLLFLSTNGLLSLPPSIFIDLISLKYVSLFANKFPAEERERIKRELPATLPATAEVNL